MVPLYDTINLRSSIPTPHGFPCTGMSKNCAYSPAAYTGFRYPLGLWDQGEASQSLVLAVELMGLQLPSGGSQLCPELPAGKDAIEI